MSLPSSTISILSIIFLTFLDLKVWSPFPKSKRSINFVFARAFSLVDAREKWLSSTLATKYEEPEESLSVLNPTFVDPIPIGVPVARYVTSSPSKNLWVFDVILSFRRSNAKSFTETEWV